MIELTLRDRQRLRGVHPDLVKVVEEVARTTTTRFQIVQGGRSIEQQKKNISAGVSWTMNSRHLPDRNGTVFAVDIGLYTAGGKYEQSWQPYNKMALEFKKAAAKLKIPIVWGGDWKKTPDGPHYELDRKKYPAKK